MAQCLRTPDALSEDLGLVNSPVTPVQGHLTLFWLLCPPGMNVVHIRTCRQNIYTHK